MKLWYENPAKNWDESFPIGNGRLGACVFGNPNKETIQLNEDSVWSGKSLNRLNPDASTNLGKIRKYLREGKILEAQQLSAYALAGVPNSQRGYQTAGELFFNFHNQGQVTEYRRELDLNEGLIKINYKADETEYNREVFSSLEDGVIVIGLIASGKNKMNFDCHFGRVRHFTDEILVHKNEGIGFVLDGGDGISFAQKLVVGECDGEVETIGEHLIIKNATVATLLINIETSFRHENYKKVCMDKLEKASRAPYYMLYNRHIKEFSSLAKRTEFIINTKEDYSKIPTDKRMENARQGNMDIGLLPLYFQFGRYLLISSSRGDCLPANLQGIWNNSLTPPWESKYTININIQMNYWLATVGNLFECNKPYFDHLKRIMENGKITARAMYDCNGSLCHHNTDIYADTNPQGLLPSCTYWVMGQAWLATHIWEHFDYTRDINFLKDNFNVLEENILFFYDFLIENDKGYLVTSPTVSPENKYFDKDGNVVSLSEGCTMDTGLLLELFNGYIKACQILDESSEKIERAKGVIEKLPPFEIGKHGQLQEWLEDYEEAEPDHRHVSHLYGLYPANLFNWEDNKDLMEGCKISLNRRIAAGGGYTGWSSAWIIGLWAKLYDGEKALENFRKLLATETFLNLMNNHPQDKGHIFQIDGNLGAAAAIIELFVQNYNNKITLLPAITEELSSGYLSGICLRGGITLAMKWEDGKVLEVEFTSKYHEEILLVANGTKQSISLIKDEVKKIKF